MLWDWRCGDAMALVEVEEQLHLAGGQDLPVSGLRIQQRRSIHVSLLFRPGFLNSLAGVISTLANTLEVQHRTFSASARITLIVTASVTVACGVLVVVYSFWMLRRVKMKHDRHIGAMRAGKYGEGKIEKTKVDVERGV